MNTSSLRKIVCTGMLALLFVSGTLNAAGFHYRLEVAATLELDEKSQLTAVQMDWLYDAELSSVLMDGEDLSADKRDEVLKRRAADILEGLDGMDYFTSLYLEDKFLHVAAVKNYTLSLADQNRLRLNLTLPLKQAADLTGKKLLMKVSDETGIGLATVSSADSVTLPATLAKLCKGPSLLKEDLGEVDGHQVFAETITIDCQKAN